jgi:hypothetical protein
MNVSLDDDSAAPVAGDPFRPASSGIRAPQPAAEQPKEGVADRKRGAMAMIGVPVLLVLVLGGLAFGAYKFMGGPDDAVVVAQPIKAFTVDLKVMQTANHGQLRDLIAESKKASPQGDEAAKVLLAKALLLSRYAEEDVAKDAQTQAEALRASSAQGGLAALAVGAWEAVRGDMSKAKPLLEPLTGDAALGYWANLFLGAGDVLRLERSGVLKLKPRAGDVKSKADAPPIDGQPAAPEKPAEEKPAGEKPADEKPAEEKPADVLVEAPVEKPAEEAKPEIDPLTEAAQALAWLEAAAKEDTALPSYWLGRLYELARRSARSRRSRRRWARPRSWSRRTWGSGARCMRAAI